ncbi:phage tail protein, partial [Enterococcus ureasiticus]|uniref:phage tail spike protein n=1 Tax=Enterococcus ureasiticus TaxID=903984 RepID=UPI001A90B429
MSEHIYFFDDHQQLVKIVNEEKIVESVQEKEITASKEELLNSILSVTITYDEELIEAAFMAVKENDNSYALYRIIKINDPENQLIFTGIDFAPDELDGYIVKDIRPNNESITSITKRLLEGTEWILGHVDTGIKNMSGTFYYISVKEALKQLQALGCEILFSCDLNADGISEKRVDIYRKIGTESTTRYTYGDKALTVVKELGRSQVYTSIIGRGKGEEVGDGYGRRLEFSDLEWKISKGDPLDKPKGQNWLEYPEMTKLYGIPTKDGKMRKREKVVIFDDEEDKKALLNNTYSELIDCSRPLVQFRATITEGDVIGNTVTIHRYDRGYHYKARIFKTTLNRLTGVTDASIGDNLSANMSRKTSQMVSGLQSLDANKMNFYSSEEISKWQSDIIRGAKGGSILLMSPSDLGISDSREPFQMVWMNGDSLGTSDHFLVANSEGIGFIDGDFNLDNFETAWTIDGVFNANYIQTGIIRANIFETSFNAYGDQLKLVAGALQAVNNKKKIMELTKKGLEFWDGNSHVGTMGTKGNPFPNLTGIDGPVVTDGNSLLLVGDDPKKIVGLSNKNNTGIAINGEQQFFLGSVFNFIGTDENKGKGTLRCERLFVNDKEITGGGSGGGGGGTPPGLTTDQEKNAWAIWSYFKARGWTEESIAGMLGNMQSESGIVADIDEVGGGGGYGLVQWTPKSKLVDWCNARGLDYRTIDSQCQRIQWEMENEQQWIATGSYPYSF